MTAQPQAEVDAQVDNRALQAQVSGSSFYAAMRIMPKAERAAMFAIYRFCRLVDDVADDGTRPRPQRAVELEAWRADLAALYEGRPAGRAAFLAPAVQGFGLRQADFLAVVDAEEGRVIHEMPLPNVGDELHHFGWNRCSSACHGPDRSHLIVPGFRSSRIHVVNVADDPRKPFIEKVIEPEDVIRETGLTRPHTVHCMPGDNIVVSMLGDAEGNGACGFAVLDAPYCPDYY